MFFFFQFGVSHLFLERLFVLDLQITDPTGLGVQFLSVLSLEGSPLCGETSLVRIKLVL